MPKILFRPAPTPPPFVPPTPSYDTQIHATFDPVEFSPDTGLEVVFQNASLPDFENFYIVLVNGNQITAQESVASFAFNTPVSMTAETSYKPSRTYYLELADANFVPIWRCEIIIDNKP